MAGFSNISELVDCKNNIRSYAWRKIPNQITPVGVWFDISSSTGNPLPKFWFDSTPLVGKPISQSLDGGIFHGSNVSPKEKYLRMTMNMCVTTAPLPMNMMLLDYLFYYPTIGEDTTDEQILDNSQTLTRYQDGEGVRIMAVSVSSRTGGQTFSVKYTNSLGISNRVTKVTSQNATSIIGSIITSERTTVGQSGAFLPLQDGDTGVRSIQSITMNGVDVGLFTLILVKPIAETYILDITAPVEVDYFIDKHQIEKIYDDAYLSYIVKPSGSLNGVLLTGTLKTIYK